MAVEHECGSIETYQRSKLVKDLPNCLDEHCYHSRPDSLERALLRSCNEMQIFIKNILNTKRNLAMKVRLNLLSRKRGR